MRNRKVTAIAVYSRNEAKDDYILLSLNVLTREEHLIELYSSLCYKPIRGKSLSDIYNAILRWLHANNMECNYHYEFGARAYNIIWIEQHDPRFLERYSITDSELEWKNH